MSEELGTSRPRRLGNHYIPPPARKQGSGIVETRAKERPTKTCSNENEKLCNDSSLLFKDSYDEVNLKLKSKRKRRSKKEPKCQKNSFENSPLVDDLGRSNHRNAANLQSTRETPRVAMTSESPMDESFKATSVHLDLTYGNCFQPSRLCNEEQRILVIDPCNDYSDGDVDERPPTSDPGPDVGIYNSCPLQEEPKLSESTLPLQSLVPESTEVSITLISSSDGSNILSSKEVDSSSNLNKDLTSNPNICSPVEGALCEPSLNEISSTSPSSFITESSICNELVSPQIEDSILPQKMEVPSPHSNLSAEFDNSSAELAENNILSTTSTNIEASTHSRVSEFNEIAAAVEGLSMNSQCSGDTLQSNRIKIPSGDEHSALTGPNPLACNNGSKTEGDIAVANVARTKYTSAPTSSYNHNNSILSIDNIDDSDWDSLYDDRGECIIPLAEAQLSKEKLKHQVSSQNNPSKYSPPKSSADEDAYQGVSTIIEIYGFPEELKTNDLMTVFCNYIDRGFNLKWVDNTHALGVLPTTALAEEILSLNLPIVKTRPISQGIALSQEKARNLVLPSALRPKTCTALARRLVSGALGLRVSVTPAERAAERELLKEAREKKKLVSKQKEAAWEGNFSLPDYSDGKDPS